MKDEWIELGSTLLYSTVVSNCVGCEINKKRREEKMVSDDDEKEGRSTVAAIGRQAGSRSS